jgi:hypothetical protein
MFIFRIEVLPWSCLKAFATIGRKEKQCKTVIGNCQVGKLELFDKGRI